MLGQIEKYGLKVMKALKYPDLSIQCYLDVRLFGASFPKAKQLERKQSVLGSFSRII